MQFFIGSFQVTFNNIILSQRITNFIDKIMNELAS